MTKSNSNHIHSSTDASVFEIPLIDPVSHAGKLRIPIEMTEDTKGRQEWLRAQGHLRKDLSVCCLYQQGRCHAGHRCHQVHVDREYVAMLRAENAGLVTCCMACGDQASAERWYRDAVRGAMATIGDAVVSAERLARTHGLEVLLQQRRGTTTITVPSGRVCRLHLRNSCKYGKDCKNVHVCSKVSDQLTVTSSPDSKEQAHPKPYRSRQEAPVPASGIATRNVSVSPPPPVPVSPTPSAEVKKRTIAPLSTVAVAPNASNTNVQPSNAVPVATPTTVMLTTFCDQWNVPKVPSSPITLPSPLTSTLATWTIASCGLAF